VASVSQQLLNLARERKEGFGLVFTEFSQERVLLYPNSKSKQREVFVLNGALLFAV